MDRVSNFLLHLFRPLSILFIFFAAFAQDQVPMGSLEVWGRLRIGDKQEKLTHKRFYLLRGGLAANKDLLDRIRKAEIISRDCYYERAKASQQFVCWLRSENCDSPNCRKLEMPDIERVPEFKAAYLKGLTSFGQKKDIAQMWLMTNLPPLLAHGFYREQKVLEAKLLAGVKPVQSSMTDGVSNKSLFVDIPLKESEEEESETFTVSNIKPIEVGSKSYVWTCEVEISPDDRAVVRLQVPENNVPVKGCEVVVRDLEMCKAGECPQ